MSWSFEKIAIVGAGAVGLYYGGRLAAAGESVKFLVRSEYEPLKARGLQVESIHGDFQVPGIDVYQSPDAVGLADLVIVSWKTTANHQLTEVLAPLVHPGTQVLTLQNGLGNCEALAKIVGEERVLGGLCFVCINRISPGLIRHSGGGRVSIGEWRIGTTPGRAVGVARRFQAAGIHGFAVEDLEKAQWEKLVWNIPFNGLSVALGGVTTDVLLASDETEAEIRAIMSEVIRTARLLGFDLDEDLIDSNLSRTRPMGAYRPSSMIDFIEGREVEVGPIWEEPLRRAADAGASMPRTRNLLEMIRRRVASRSF